MKNYKSEFLANLVFLFHICIILFIIIIPFLYNVSPALLILHITFNICLLIHWYNNSDKCSLTILEGYLRGISDNKTFTYKIISPFYTISQTKWNQILHTITILLTIISINYLYNSKNFKYFLICYKNLPSNYNWYDYFTCSTYLFQPEPSKILMTKV